MINHCAKAAVRCFFCLKRYLDLLSSCGLKDAAVLTQDLNIKSVCGCNKLIFCAGICYGVFDLLQVFRRYSDYR